MLKPSFPILKEITTSSTHGVCIFVVIFFISSVSMTPASILLQSSILDDFDDSVIDSD